jgi:hydrogenase maturation protease
MLAIIGCGNRNRRDDGAGICVVRALMEMPELATRKDLKLFDAGTAGMEVMFQAKGSNSLIIIDASHSEDGQPGAIYKVPGAELESEKEPSMSLHDFRWDHALYAGKKIFKDDFPTDVTVYLIEAAELSFGLGLTDEVQQAVDRVVEMILQSLERTVSC